MNKKHLHNKKQAGFTLIEMIVVVLIVAIMATISVLQFSSKRRGVHLDSTVEEIALNLRKAQSLALAVRSTGGTLLPQYQNGYGVHFEIGPSLSHSSGASSTSYILFTDFEGLPGPGRWDRAYLKNLNPGTKCGNPIQTLNECYEQITIESGDQITSLELCSIVGSVPSCNKILPGTGLDITFLRPNLDAYFCTNPATAGGCTNSLPNAGYARIRVTSPTGSTKSVSVWSTGQISIE